MKTGVSIVIPNWNHQNFLCRSMHSAIVTIELLAERGIPAELIVVDDESRDGSRRYIQAVQQLYTDVAIRLQRQGENRGLGAARNAGIAQSRYRYVIVMDADNALEPRNVYLFLQSMQATEAAMVYGNLFIAEDGSVNRLCSNQVLQSDVHEDNYVDAFSMLDKYQLAQAEGYTEDRADHGGWEDWELIQHMLCEDRLIVFVPLVFGYYFVNDLSMILDTNAQNNKMLPRMYRVFDQNQLRSLPKQLLGRAYHPAVGYLV